VRPQRIERHLPERLHPGRRRRVLDGARRLRRMPLHGLCVWNGLLLLQRGLGQHLRKRVQEPVRIQLPMNEPSGSFALEGGLG